MNPAGTKRMRSLIASFPQQLRKALEMDFSEFEVDRESNTLATEDITLCGMGGSGMSGSIVRELVQNLSVFPTITNHEHIVAPYANSDSLIIATSYSGNTEETLSAVRSATYGRIICVTSGGKLARIAKKNGYNLVKLPSGLPPRAALAYAVVAQLSILDVVNIAPDGFRKDVGEAADLLESEQQTILRIASKVAGQLAGKLTAVYCDSGMESVAMRFRQQLAENAKQLAWHHVLPEMNHNELVGWRNAHKDVGVVFLRSKFEHPRTKLRINYTAELLRKKAGYVAELRAKGKSKIAQWFYLIHLGDWISQLIGEKLGIDTLEVKEIDHQKKHLAETTKPTKPKAQRSKETA